MAVDTRTFESDLAFLQGLWTEEQYLRITEQTNHLIEFTDGAIEVLPMPTRNHQLSLLLLCALLREFIRPRGGIVVPAPFRVYVRPGAYREPDIVLLLDASDPRNQNESWHGADLVVEVVSPDWSERDIVEKRRDYAVAGIPEYWIVNPLDETITVLNLQDDAYAEHGVFRRGDRATSLLLVDFEVTVDEVLDAS